MYSEKSAHRVVAPVCIVNSLPKSGTHLLQKVVASLRGMTLAGIDLKPDDGAPDFDESAGASGSAIPIGVGRPRSMPRERVHGLLESLVPGSIIKGHIPYSSAMASVLEGLPVRMISITRDPRDVAVSQAKFVATTPGIALHDYYRSLSEDERIMTAITGVSGSAAAPPLRNLRERLESVLRWRAHPQHLATTFERLVGPRGGGGRSLQLQEIDAIARHLGIACDAAEIERIADRAFGGTETFQTGAIGTWRGHFTPAHVRACKVLLGTLLIEQGYERSLDW